MRHTVQHLFVTLLVLFGAAATLVALPTAAAHAAPASCEYPAAACECPTVAVSTTVPRPGEVVAVTGAGFVSDKRVALMLQPMSGPTSDNPTMLRTVRTKSTGTFATSVTIPKQARGRFALMAAKATPTGATTAAGVVCPANASTPIQVVEAANDPANPDGDHETTAFTGINLLWLLLLAAALVGVGIYVTRRGRQAEVVRSIHG